MFIELEDVTNGRRFLVNLSCLETIGHDEGGVDLWAHQGEGAWPIRNLTYAQVREILAFNGLLAEPISPGETH